MLVAGEVLQETKRGTGGVAMAVADGYINQRMFMLRMSQNDDLVYTVLANEKAHGLAASDNGVEGIMEDCSLLECGLDGANILQQVEIYAFKSDGQFEVQYQQSLVVVAMLTGGISCFGLVLCRARSTSSGTFE